MAVLLSELERTGAFDRKVLVIVPTTGTGWINPVAARVAGDDVQRRHRDGRIAVFLSAELDFVPRRPAEVDGLRPADDRRHPRPVATTTARPPAQAGAVRRKPRLDGRAGRVRVAARHCADGFLLGAVGRSAQRQPAVEGASPNVATPARRRWNRATTTGAPCGFRRPPTPRRSAATPRRRGRAPGCCSCSIRRTRSSGGRRICCSTGRTG